MKMLILTVFSLFSLNAVAGGFYLNDGKSEQRSAIKSVEIKYKLQGNLPSIIVKADNGEVCTITHGVETSISPTGALAAYNTLASAFQNRLKDDGMITVLSCETKKIVLHEVILKTMIDDGKR